jgi:hypothetical protein
VLHRTNVHCQVACLHCWLHAHRLHLHVLQAQRHKDCMQTEPCNTCVDDWHINACQSCHTMLACLNSLSLHGCIRCQATHTCITSFTPHCKCCPAMHACIAIILRCAEKPPPGNACMRCWRVAVQPYTSLTVHYQVMLVGLTPSGSGPVHVHAIQCRHSCFCSHIFDAIYTHNPNLCLTLLLEFLVLSMGLVKSSSCCTMSPSLDLWW